MSEMRERTRFLGGKGINVWERKIYSREANATEV